ncbi:MAG: metallophosphoesterase [Lysobacterales bacterium]
MSKRLYFNPHRRENALWASAVETYLRRKHPDLSLHAVRNLPMMQGVYRHLMAWEAGRALAFPADPAQLAELSAPERQALLSQAFLGLGTLHLVAASAGEDYYNDTFIPAVLAIDNTFQIRQFSTDDLPGFASCLVIWAYYYWAGIPGVVLPLISRLLDAVVEYLQLTPEQIAEIREAQREIESLLGQINGTGYRTAPENYGAITFPDNARIIILGDWGTSLPDAQALLEAVWDLTYTHDPSRPILFLHLGDIYYSGLPVECQQNFYDVFARARQTLASRYGQAFQSSAAQSKIYAIPGNHEYYSKGYGYFQLIDQLNAELGTGQLCSFFCLRNQSQTFQFLGMDTGQGDHNAFEPIAPIIFEHLLPWAERRINELVPFPLSIWVDRWLEATIEDYTGPFPPQLQSTELSWHRARLAEAPRTQTILLSHHQLYSAVEAIDHRTPQFVNTHLLKDFQSYFLSQVPMWLWGHEHSYAIYGFGTFGLDQGRLLGSSSFEASQATDHPYRVAFPEIPFDPGMPVPQQSNGYYDHACAVLDFGTDNPPVIGIMNYYQYPSWGQEDAPPASAQLSLLYSEILGPARGGVFKPQWNGNLALAPDLVDKKGNYLSNPYQSTSAPAIAFGSDRTQPLMVWRDSSDNSLHWAVGLIGTSNDDIQTPTLQWSLMGKITATTSTGTLNLSTDAAPVLVGCGKIFLLVFKRSGGQQLCSKSSRFWQVIAASALPRVAQLGVESHQELAHGGG